MLGCYDFCAHYDWTFDWIEREGGYPDLVEYWDAAIRGDSQQHASQLIGAKGIEGMSEYWGQTLSEEAPNGGFQARIEDGRFLVEMTDCPSRGFLLRNKVEFSKDYCDHCLGWIGPMMRDANFKIKHAHNHLGQCYWEFYPKSDEGKLSQSVEEWKKSLLSDWKQQGAKIDQSPSHDPAGTS